jgi:ubiquinone/menaquinone biosynthesis C-methylase UbiE
LILKWSDKKIRKAWNHYVKDHDDVFASVGRVDDFDQLRIGLEDITQKLSLEPSNALLEIGCGTGLLLSFLRDSVSAAAGLDFSIKAIDIARRRLSTLPFVVGDSLDLPFKKDSFDRILAYSVFHYVKDVKKAIEETLRVCRGGGIVLIGDLPDIRWRWELYFFYMRSFLQKIKSLTTLWEKVRERIYSVGWYWVDVEALKNEIQLMGHEVEILPQPKHAQFGCNAYQTRVDLRIKKRDKAGG